MNTTTITEDSRAWINGRRRRGEISPSAATSYLRRVDHFTRTVGPALPVDRLRPRHIDKWRESLSLLRPASQRSYWVTVRAWMATLVMAGALAIHPMASMPTPRVPRGVPRALTREQVGAVLSVAEPRVRVIVIIAVQMGLRRCEVARLRVEDLDLGSRIAIIHGKGDHVRAVPIPEQALEVVVGWLDAEGIRRGPIIRSQTDPSRGLTPHTISLLVAGAMRRAGIKHTAWDRVSAHSLRHTALSDMLRHGAHVRDVQAVAGHTQLQTTEKYLPLTVATLSAAVDGRRYG